MIIRWLTIMKYNRLLVQHLLIPGLHLLLLKAAGALFPSGCALLLQLLLLLRLCLL
jgi:hypothetical protein